MGGLDC
ncbi:rCG55303 [Rattus norvegicus]|nr:rCG55303 [Rattus norvegicus]